MDKTTYLSTRKAIDALSRRILKLSEQEAIADNGPAAEAFFTAVEALDEARSVLRKTETKA